MSIPTDKLEDLSMIDITKKRKLHRQIPKDNIREGKVDTIVDTFFYRLNRGIKTMRKRILKVSIYNTIVGTIIFTGSIIYNLPVLYSFFGFSLIIMSINGIIIGVK